MRFDVRFYINKYKNISIQTKAAFWFALCNIVQKGISMVTVPIFTRMMSSEQYGNYTVYLSWQSILLIFTSLNLYYGVFNNAMIKYKEDRDKYISSMQGLTFVITSAFFIFYLFVRKWANIFLGMNTMMVCILFAQLLSMPPLLFWTARQRFEFRYRAMVVVTLLKAILNPILGILAVWLSTEKDVARIVSIVVVEVVIGGIICFLQFMKGKQFYNRIYWKYAFLFNVPLLPHYLSGVILNQSDRVMIASFVGSSEAAYYTIAYSIGTLMLLFTDAINNSFTPWMYVKMKEKDFNAIKKTGNSLVLLIGILIVLLLLFAPEILFIFASSEYKSALYVIPPVAVTTFLIFVYVIYANIEFYYEENKMIMVASVLSAVLNVILNYFFIPIFGYYAAAYTTLFCYVIYTVSHFLFSRVVLNKHEGFRDIFDYRFIFGLFFILMMMQLIITFLYKLIIIRYMLGFVLLVLIYVKREILISIIKGVRKA